MNDAEQKPYLNQMKNLALQIGQKVSFDLISHFDKNDSMLPICSSMRTVFMFSDQSFTLKDEEPSILQGFLDEYYLKDQCAKFLDIMWNCT